MAAIEATAEAMEAIKVSTMKELKGVCVLQINEKISMSNVHHQTEKRDTLVANEKKYQVQWQKDGVFEPSAPTFKEVPFHSISNADMHRKHPKFFGLMAYPYQNGTLHAGHTLTISKVEFAAGFARMQGKRTLFPMGFHCTGMAVKACADKLVNEIKLFGQNFERYSDEEITEADKKNDKIKAANTTHEDVTKFTSKKGKSAAKSVKVKYQFQIMRALNIPLEEIHKFADAQYWFQFFPPLCRRDLTNLGARIDWRRSMVTTDANPYYDSFVRWQMNRLRELGKIKFGKRYTIYSPKDGQPCMDHDRSEGEAVGPQEYTALKLKVLEWSPEAQKVIDGTKLPRDAKVFFVAATLRPETMYGQTCCFVGPSITYGIYKVSDSDFYITTDRAARNMAFQGTFAEDGKSEKVGEIVGSACIGTLVNAPISFHKNGVRMLPMETVLATKGTGVVTSVPSDSPDDYATVRDLAKKADYYKIKKEWAELEIVSVIKTPSCGELTAPFLVEKYKISSPKDTKQLEIAKEEAYKEGFYKGIMTYGDFTGEKVEDAKPKVRKHLIDSGEAFAYAEPERKVVSRSADECCVALMDQWYLDYGEDSWKEIALEHVKNEEGKGMETWADETKNAFEGVLNWLNKWACARTYGHGSKLPWDPTFMVESLSDSTIYMAFYTISHFLNDDIFGKRQGTLHIKPEQMTDDVWDYIFARRDLTDEVLSESGIPREKLDIMRREFEYWYPVDVNISGKDLIPNHLTFFIYVHLAIWEKQKEYWPRGVRCNGHLLLNGEKMAKSTGNFMTLEEMVNKFGADATRIAIADAGDGMADANFEEDVADNNILRLYNLREWCQEQVQHESKLRSGPKDQFFDKLFENDMNSLVHECYTQYEATNYKLALKSALYDFTAARDFYRDVMSAANVAMHKDLVYRYVELQALLLAVIAPHWSEHIWLEVLNKPATIQNALFPSVPNPDPALTAARDYVRGTFSAVLSSKGAQKKKRDKGKEVALDLDKPIKLTIFVASRFPEWQDKYIDMVRGLWNTATRSLDNDQLMAEMKRIAGKDMKKTMPFVQDLKKRLLAGERAQTVFNRQLVFDEKETLREMVAGLKRQAILKDVAIVEVREGEKIGFTLGGQEVELPAVAGSAVPGAPTFVFENVEG